MRLPVASMGLRVPSRGKKSETSVFWPKTGSHVFVPLKAIMRTGETTGGGYGGPCIHGYIKPWIRDVDMGAPLYSILVLSVASAVKMNFNLARTRPKSGIRKCN